MLHDWHSLLMAARPDKRPGLFKDEPNYASGYHPFDDGNGRISRLLSNAGLSSAGQVRIIIPTVYRNNYLAALTGVTQLV